MNLNVLNSYNLWKNKATEDTDIMAELKAIENDESKINDAFYRNLEFGTGGLRGVIGAGTNRMNIYTVAKASQGLSNYINKHFKNGSVAISYDSRIKSDIFSKIASEVFAANGLKVYIYSELMPTPLLSFAVRKLRCRAGVMITASHNPSVYNGYKVYGEDGCQITTEAASKILNEIEATDTFKDVKRVNFDDAINNGKIEYISSSVYDDFIEKVSSTSVISNNDKIDRNISIIYSPLNGTGAKPVVRALKENGFSNIITVEEQFLPDGNFPTCPYPNPEKKEAMLLGVEYAKKHNAELLLATDPDCDRVGIAVKEKNGEYKLLTGNEVGVLLLDFICRKRIENGTMPKNPVFIKTIVTTDLAEQIANSFNVKTINVLTGFKFIGEQIGLLEQKGIEDSYILGFEESYGYLSGTYVRDKDGVNGAFIICEMFAYYKSKGIGLLDKLEELYKQYGYTLNTLHSYRFEGEEGFLRMREIMDGVRCNISSYCSKQITNILDYKKGIDNLPASDVIKVTFDGNCSLVIRPSGTEPLIKVYISVNAKNKKEAENKTKEIVSDIEKQINENTKK